MPFGLHVVVRGLARMSWPPTHGSQRAGIRECREGGIFAGESLNPAPSVYVADVLETTTVLRIRCVSYYRTAVRPVCLNYLSTVFACLNYYCLPVSTTTVCLSQLTETTTVLRLISAHGI